MKERSPIIVRNGFLADKEYWELAKNYWFNMSSKLQYLCTYRFACRVLQARRLSRLQARRQLINIASAVLAAVEHDCCGRICCSGILSISYLSVLLINVYCLENNNGVSGVESWIWIFSTRNPKVSSLCSTYICIWNKRESKKSGGGRAQGVCLI